MLVKAAAQRLHPLASVRSVEVQFRPDRNDPRRVDLVVGDVVVALDVVEVHRLGDAGLLVEIPQIALRFG